MSDSKDKLKWFSAASTKTCRAYRSRNDCYTIDADGVQIYVRRGGGRDVHYVVRGQGEMVLKRVETLAAGKKWVETWLNDKAAKREEEGKHDTAF